MPSRTSLPVCLPGATKFSDDRAELLDDRWAVRWLAQQPQWREPLLNGTDLDKNWGRPRIPGRWAYAYLMFVSSRQADVEPWWGRTTDSDWQACGFPSRPSYQTVQGRFVELEDSADVFQQVTALLIQHARRRTGGLVGRDVHVDGTEAETNARLVHDCQPGEGCRREGGGKKKQGPKLPGRVSAADARATRHTMSSEAPGDPDELELGAATDFTIDDQRRRARVKAGDCYYRTLDTDAGIRAYINGGKVKRFWHGYYNHKAIDHYTGAPIRVLVTSSSIQEHLSYPELLQDVIKTVGDKPRAVVGDRGFSVRPVFELNTKEGIASVFPWRKRSGNIKREDEDTDRYDRHGVPRCPHCGGPTTHHRSQGGNAARLWFRCEIPVTPECEKVGSIACSHDYRLLVPLWRTEEAYLALRDSHSQYERVHTLWRSRYAVGADNHATRPKRIGAACQQLRANAALLIEWLRIIDREGWAGSARRNTGAAIERHAVEGLKRLRHSRAKHGLHLPYGPVADALRLTGVLPMKPPPENFAAPPPADLAERPF